MNKEESDQKYGWRIHDDPVRATEIGVSVCPVCRESSKLVQRQTSGFKNILSVCRHGHTCEIVKAVYEKYQIGDRIRRYESTFGKDAAVRLDCYTEGVIEKSYPSLVDWLFDYRIDKCVSNGTEIKPPAWIIGHLSVGSYHHDKHVVLLQKAASTVTYTQENLIL